MDVRGAVKIDLSAKPGELGYTSANGIVTRNIPSTTGNAQEDFANLVAWYNVPDGVASIYIGDTFVPLGDTPAFPFMLDWRLYHGTSICGVGSNGVYDQDCAAGSTIFKTASGFKREGLLFQWGGLQADSFVLAGRVRGTGEFQLKMTIFPKFTPGLGGSISAITVGSAIG